MAPVLVRPLPHGCVAVRNFPDLAVGREKGLEGTRPQRVLKTGRRHPHPTCSTPMSWIARVSLAFDPGAASRIDQLRDLERKERISKKKTNFG
jgi:hypothetical protein